MKKPAHCGVFGRLNQLLNRVLFLLGFACLPVAMAAPVSYQNEVMAVLAKAGCNMGTCHGNANGKGGFKISLRGESPAGD